MTFDEDENEFILSTGRRMYANLGIVGIDSDLETYEGYDGSFARRCRQPLTKAEREEVAEFMVQLWTKWAAAT